MRLPIACLLAALSALLGAADTGTATAAAADTPTPATSTAAAGEAPTMVQLRNERSLVEIDPRKGAIRYFRDLTSYPIPLKPWQSDREPGEQELEEPVAVLGTFHDKPWHSWFVDGEIYKQEPWTLRASDSRSASFTTLSRDGGLRYIATYTLDAVDPTVHVRLETTNEGTGTVALQPMLIPINGVHKDLAHTESYDSGVFYQSAPGEGLDSIDVPDVPEKQHTNNRGPITPFTDVNYIAVKSRFFAGIYQPGTFQIRGPEEEEQQDAADGPAVGPGIDESELPGDVASSVRSTVQVTSFNTGSAQRPEAHVWLLVRWPQGDGSDKLKLEPGQTLEIDYRLTATSLKKEALETLGDDIAKIEYTDWMYRFFKILANFFTWILSLLTGFYHAIGIHLWAGGLAVITTTLLVKAALHRITYKQQKSMMMMQKVAPELKKLQGQYKDNRQVLAQKQMELYRQHGVNPLGGCLPIFIMMPIFVGLYNAFRHAADLRGKEFLWINDLTLPDQVLYLGFDLPLLGPATLNPLPLIYIAVSLFMSFQMKVPENAEKMQQDMAKMMRFLPVMFGLIFYQMPAGLVLYFTVQAIVSAIETKYIRKQLGMD